MPELGFLLLINYFITTKVKKEPGGGFSYYWETFGMVEAKKNAVSRKGLVNGV